ncbi:hypothetical protein P7K49_012185 [Saguinus oedipus]|uniref:Uncharacterized protein n=1 Tax=Saguinus oedipus TaxID=9490 RepID=A0ABQ9VSR7_SAGOE|nr:hypothetical protein P7K49_012185 [Saguinus oedipus]
MGKAGVKGSGSRAHPQSDGPPALPPGECPTLSRPAVVFGRPGTLLPHGLRARSSWGSAFKLTHTTRPPTGGCREPLTRGPSLCPGPGAGPAGGRVPGVSQPWLPGIECLPTCSLGLHCRPALRPWGWPGRLQRAIRQCPPSPPARRDLGLPSAIIPQRQGAPGPLLAGPGPSGDKGCATISQRWQWKEPMSVWGRSCVPTDGWGQGGIPEGRASSRDQQKGSLATPAAQTARGQAPVVRGWPGRPWSGLGGTVRSREPTKLSLGLQHLYGIHITVLQGLQGPSGSRPSHKHPGQRQGLHRRKGVTLESGSKFSAPRWAGNPKKGRPEQAHPGNAWGSHPRLPGAGMENPRAWQGRAEATEKGRLLPPCEMQLDAQPRLGLSATASCHTASVETQDTTAAATRPLWRLRTPRQLPHGLCGDSGHHGSCHTASVETQNATASCHTASVETQGATASCHSASVETQDSMANCHTASVETQDTTASCHMASVETQDATASCHSASVETQDSMANCHTASVETQHHSQLPHSLCGDSGLVLAGPGRGISTPPPSS